MDYNITLNQLAGVPKGGAYRLIATIGAKNIGYSEKENYVAFRFMRGAKNKANYIKITLNSMDLYNVEFGKIHGLNYKVISNDENLYDDMLFTHFTESTGLALRL